MYDVLSELALNPLDSSAKANISARLKADVNNGISIEINPLILAEIFPSRGAPLHNCASLILRASSSKVGTNRKAIEMERLVS